MNGTIIENRAAVCANTIDDAKTTDEIVAWLRRWADGADENDSMDAHDVLDVANAIERAAAREFSDAATIGLMIGAEGRRDKNDLKRARHLLKRIADAFEEAVIPELNEKALIDAARAEAAKTIPEPAGESGETNNTQTETTKP